MTPIAILESRAAEARDALDAALLSGSDTRPHRSALAAAESELTAARGKQDLQRQQVEAQAAAAIAQRAGVLLAEARASLDSLMQQYEAPELFL